MNAVRLFGFWYGCVGAVCALAWYVAAISGHAVLPGNVWIVEGVFAVHALAAILTFQRRVTRPAWKPLLEVTPGRLRTAKLILSIAVANFTLCLGVFLFAEVRSDLTLGGKIIHLILSGFLLLNTVYIALHWAFRPENLFSVHFLRVITNPVSLLISAKKDDGKRPQ